MASKSSIGGAYAQVSVGDSYIESGTRLQGG